jgi:hypothetical protein
MKIAVSAAVMVTAFSSATIHILVERPLLRLGRRIANLTR